MRSLHGKTVLITGAASGIGRAMAQSFAREGAVLQLLDFDESRLLQVVSELKTTGANCDAVVCDLADGEQIVACVEGILDSCGHVDVLINNAGICYYGPTIRMTPEQCERILAVNFLAPVRLTQRLLPTLLSRPESHIINVSSMYGLYVTRRCSTYHTTKYGLIGLTDSLRAEYGRYGLGVTSLCPGFVRTGLFDGMMRPRDRDVPQPPQWISTTPEKVAAKAVRAVIRNRRLVLATPLAHLACYVLRLFPGLLDRLNRIGPRREFRMPVDEPSATIRLHVPRDEQNDIDAMAA